MIKLSLERINAKSPYEVKEARGFSSLLFKPAGQQVTPTNAGSILSLFSNVCFNFIKCAF